MYESLHNHTNISDGKQTHLEVLETAGKSGYGVIAFTDHDILPDESIIGQLKSYDGPVKWLLGCELSSGLPKELGGGPVSMFHIVGLFTDPYNPALREHCRQMVEAREERMQKMVKNLQSLGLVISVDDCLEASGGEAVGRPHIVSALWLHQENEKIIDDIAAKMERAAEADAELRESYDIMKSQDKEYMPYRLFLDSSAFYPDVYVDYLYWQDMDNTVKLIRDAGGVALLAHWGTIKKKIDRNMLEGFLRDGRLDGVETVTFALGLNTKEFEKALEEMATDTDCLRSIGVDAHKPEHFQTFVDEHPKAKESHGTAARLVERVQPDLTHSNMDR